MIKPRFSRTLMPTHAGSGMSDGTDCCAEMTDWAQLLAVSCGRRGQAMCSRRKQHGHAVVLLPLPDIA
jgi:hypothetical protein